MYKVIFITFFLTNCATILKGYHDKVEICFSTGSEIEKMEIFDEYGEKLPIHSSKRGSTVVDVVLNPKTGKRLTIYASNNYIRLRSNEKHILEVRTDEHIEKIALFPKVGIGWITLDIVTGVFPLVIDLYNGNLNHFDNIIIQNIE